MKICKRIMAFLLVLTLMLPTISVEVSADTEAHPVNIMVMLPEATRGYSVYEWDGDLYFSAGQLAEMSQFQLEETDEYVQFTRSAKTVRIYLKENKMETILCGEVADTMTIYLMEEKGVTYFSGSHVIPYLNVTCDAYGSRLVVVRDDVSLWDFIEDFDINQYKFNFSDCCEKIGVSSSALKVQAFFERQGLTSVYYTGGINDGYGSYTDYFTVLDNYMQDLSSSDAAVEAASEGFGLVDAGLSYLNALREAEYLPYEMTYYSNVAASLSVIDYGLECASYYTAYNSDNEMKMSILDTMIECADSKVFTDECDDAASVLSASYQSFWIGLLFKTGQFLADELVTELAEKTLEMAAGGPVLTVTLAAVDMVSEVDKDWTEAIDDIRTHMKLISGTKEYYKKGFGQEEYSAWELEDKIGFAALYLNCMEQCYRGMRTYMYETGHYDKELYDECGEIADELQEWQGKFQAAFSSRYNDSTTHSTSGDGSVSRISACEHLEEVFAELHRAEPVSATMSYVEYAIVLDKLREWNARNLEWTFADIDSDGVPEMLAVCDLADWTDWQATQLLIDADDMTSWANTVTGSAGGAEYYMAQDGNEWYWNTGYYSVGNQQSAYYKWNGSSWDKIAYYIINIDEAAAGEGGPITSQEIYWMGGELSSQEEFYNKSSELMTSAVYSNTDLADFTIKGETEALFTELDEYISSRYGHITDVRADIDQDGDDDMLIALSDGAGNWFENIKIEDASWEEPYVDYEDDKLTLIAAENIDGGLRIRVTTMMPEGVFSYSGKETKYTLQGDILTIGDSAYQYQATGDVYVERLPEAPEVSERPYEESDLPEAGAVGLMDLLGMSKVDAAAVLDNYQEISASVAEGVLDGTPVTVYTDSLFINGFSVNNTGGYAQIVHAVPLNTSRENVWGVIQPTSEWSELQAHQIGYGTSFTYYNYASAYEYNCNIVFDSEDPDAKLLSMDVTINISNDMI